MGSRIASPTFGDNKCIKRSVLSDLARIFDPVGFLTPVTFFAKHFVQLLWVLGTNWDESPPADLVQRLKHFKSAFCMLTFLAVYFLKTIMVFVLLRKRVLLR